jgi:Zn-dependent peptidase ImmA (M78 family)
VGRAWRLTQDYCLDRPEPVPVEDIAMDSGVLCLEATLTGCLAHLVRKGNRGILRTHNGIRESGRRRFAVAHELGHWFLHESESQIFICTGENMRDYKGSPMEVEANLFASELLLPTPVFRPLAESADPRLEIVKDLAGKFDTSLTATGMKFVDESQHECILVLSKGESVTWSKQKGKRSGLRIDKGMKLHESSLAFYAATEGDRGPEAVPAEAWITQNAYKRQIEVTEQSWFLRDYSSVLTLLVVVDADGAKDYDMVRHYQRLQSRP